MNSLYQQLIGKATPNKFPQLSKIKNIINLIQFSKNPQAALNQMMEQNPQVRQAFNYVQQSGGDPKAAFFNLAKENGINPDEILNTINQLKTL